MDGQHSPFERVEEFDRDGQVWQRWIYKGGTRAMEIVFVPLDLTLYKYKPRRDVEKRGGVWKRYNPLGVKK